MLAGSLLPKELSWYRRLLGRIVCRESAMLGKRKEPKRKSIALSLMRDVQGSAAQKLAMFEKMRAAGGFANERPFDLAEAEKMLREFVAMEKEG